MNDLSPIAADQAAPLSPVHRPDAAGAIIAAAQQLLPHLERGQRVDAAILRAAMEAAFGASDASGAWDWKTAYDACEAATVLFLRKYGKALFRKADSPASPAFRLDQDRRPSPDPHPPLRRERGLPAILHADPARPRRPDRRRHRARGPRAGAFGRNRPPRHPGRDRRRRARAERAGRDPVGAAHLPLSGRSRHALRRRPDRRSPRSGRRPERRADEPAVLGDGERRRPHGRHRLSPYRLGARASRRRRAAGGDHRRELRAGRPGLARRLRPAAGARPHRVHGRDRRRGLRQARHHDRHAADRHRQGARREPGGAAGIAGHRARRRDLAGLDRGARSEPPAARDEPRHPHVGCRRTADGARLSRPRRCGAAGQAVRRRPGGGRSRL